MLFLSMVSSEKHDMHVQFDVTEAFIAKGLKG